MSAELILSLLTLLVGLLTGAIIGVAYLHRTFVSQRRYEQDQRRTETALRDIGQKADDLLQTLIASSRRRRQRGDDPEEDLS